jgi:hypothetical protein
MIVVAKLKCKTKMSSFFQSVRRLEVRRTSPRISIPPIFFVLKVLVCELKKTHVYLALTMAACHYFRLITCAQVSLHPSRSDTSVSKPNSTQPLWAENESKFQINNGLAVVSACESFDVFSESQSFRIQSTSAVFNQRVFVCFLIIAFAVLTQSAVAATHVLLIGVSGYPSLPESRRLSGPSNDVQVMRNALVHLGVRPTSIRTLADGVVGSSGIPTRNAILADLTTLARQAKPKDWVIIYFSGHGSQQPQAARQHAYIEPDGMDEIFLPYDIGKWDGGKNGVEGAIIDDEIAQALGLITSKGAWVWAIFDTCHAGGMAKGGLGNTESKAINRFIPPALLGVPRSEATQSQPERTRGHAIREIDKAVLFYAAHPDEPAAEERLPSLINSVATTDRETATADKNDRRYFGLFTYLLVQALPAWKGNFGKLAEVLAQKYRVRPFPTPMFEGSLQRNPDFRKNILPLGLTPTNVPSPNP